jgi:hypothetical protein
MQLYLDAVGGPVLPAFDMLYFLSSAFLLAFGSHLGHSARLIYCHWHHGHSRFLCRLLIFYLCCPRLSSLHIFLISQVIVCTSTSLDFRLLNQALLPAALHFQYFIL